MWYKKRKITTFILLGVFILFFLFVYKKYIYAPEPFYKPNVIVQQNLQQHILKNYGYSFLYSNDYVLQGHAPEPKPPEDDSFYFHRNRKSEPILNSTISIYKIGDRKNQESLDFAKQYFNKWLGWKHISSKFQPPTSGKVIDIKYYPFTTPYGVKGYEFYCTVEETEDRNPAKQSYHKMGPYITFELVDKTDNSFVAFKIFGGDTFEGRDAIRLFLNSLHPL